MYKYETALGDDDLRAIGRITANFALLELMISSCIWSLVGSEIRDAQIITAELSCRHLRALLSSLYRQRTSDPEAISELDSLVARIAEAEKKRNVVTHSLWGADPSSGAILRMKMTAKQSKGFHWQRQEMNTKDLEQIANFISEVATDVAHFLRRVEGRNSKG